MTPSAAPQHTTDANSSPPVTHYRTATVDDLDIFYREAGPANGSAIVLLHGFPTSSHMFRCQSAPKHDPGSAPNHGPHHG